MNIYAILDFLLLKFALFEILISTSHNLIPYLCAKLFTKWHFYLCNTFVFIFT